MFTSRFEKFAQMALEEFGCKVEKRSQQQYSFETLFGMSRQYLQQFNLPYDITMEELFVPKVDFLGDAAPSSEFGAVLSSTFENNKLLTLAA